MKLEHSNLGGALGLCRWLKWEFGKEIIFFFVLIQKSKENKTNGKIKKKNLKMNEIFKKIFLISTKKIEIQVKVFFFFTIMSCFYTIYNPVYFYLLHSVVCLVFYFVFFITTTIMRFEFSILNILSLTV